MTNDARGTRRRKGQLPVVTDLSTPDWDFDRPSVRRGILMEWWFAWWAPLVFIPVSGLLALALLWLLQSIAPVPEQLQQQFALLGGVGWLAAVALMLTLFFLARRDRARHHW